MIPVNQPNITKDDVKSLVNTVKSGWISSSGPIVEKFENKFAKFIGKKYGISVSSGTAALEIAIKSLNLKKGSEIIIPNFNIISSALAAIKQNLKPVFVDCHIETWNMEIEEIKKKISKKTKAIIAVHIYGYPVDMNKLKKLCNTKKIFLIEDAAELLGANINHKLCGSFGDISIFSFYANKHITTGEGGMILTNNPKLKNKIKSLRNLCFGKKDRFNHDDIGWNYRLTSMQAAIGISQLKRIKKIIREKKRIGKLYYNLLKNNKKIFIQKPRLKNCENIYWVVGIISKDKKKTAKKMMEILKKKGIEKR
jgi:perosamine synthetase